MVQVLFYLVLVVGVFLVIFGLYEKLINSVLHFFKSPKKNFLFLFPIALGAFISIFLFSKILLLAFNKYYIYTSFCFIGLILGSVPSVFKQIETPKIDFCHIICLVLTFVFSIYLIAIEKESTYALSSFSNSYLIIAGFFMSAGIVIPGVSKTAILMMLGLYSNYLLAISTLNFSMLCPMGIGLILGAIIFMYIINFLFAHFKSYTYFLIIGFVIGSCFVILPSFTFNSQYIIGIFISIFSFFMAYKLGRGGF